MLLAEIMKIRGLSPWTAGGKPTLADLYLGQACSCVSLVDAHATARNLRGHRTRSRSALDGSGFEAVSNPLPLFATRGLALRVRSNSCGTDLRCRNAYSDTDQFVLPAFCITISATR